MPSMRIHLALIALLVLAGCTGLSAPDGGPPKAGDPTNAPGSGGSPSTTVPPCEVVAYDDLPAETRRAVRAAIEEGSVVRDVTAFDGLSPGERQYVRYDGTTYALAWDHASMRAEYGLEAVERVDDPPDDANESVVAYTNLSATGQRLFDGAVNGSGSNMYGSETFPQAFLEYRYVEYQGHRYRTLVVHADVPRWELRVEEAHR